MNNSRNMNKSIVGSEYMKTKKRWEEPKSGSFTHDRKTGLHILSSRQVIFVRRKVTRKYKQIKIPLYN